MKVGSTAGCGVLGRTSLGEGLTSACAWRRRSAMMTSSWSKRACCCSTIRGAWKSVSGPGLPDVLTGYAPNNFQFTSAEFGPASGPSLDPGGRLQTLLTGGARASTRFPRVARCLGGLVRRQVRQDPVRLAEECEAGWRECRISGDAEDASVAELVQAGTHARSVLESERAALGRDVCSRTNADVTHDSSAVARRGRERCARRLTDARCGSEL